MSGENPFYPLARRCVQALGESQWTGDETTTAPGVDPELVGRARAGDERALEELLLEITPRVFRLALRLSSDARIAEEIVNEALYRGSVRLHGLREERAVGAWFAGIAVNLWRDRLRRKERRRSRREVSIDDVAEPLAPLDSQPESRATTSELRDEVARALSRLPPLQRAVMALRVDADLDIEETAQVLGTTAERVKANLWHARKRLKETLGNRVTDRRMRGERK